MALLSEPTVGVAIHSLEELMHMKEDRQRFVVHFWAGWCEPCNLIDVVLGNLQERWKEQVTMARLEAESVPEAALRYDVQAVPTVVLFFQGKVQGKVQGADAPSVGRAVELLIEQVSQSEDVSHVGKEQSREESIPSRCERLCRSQQVMLFLKGTSDEPKCKYSRKAIELLKENEIDHGTFDVLRDEDIRNGMKTYSNCSTYPQLYVNGKLLGGSDTIQDLHDRGLLHSTISDLLADVDTKERSTKDRSQGTSCVSEEMEPIENRLERLIRSSDVMLFMKGRPEQPLCGFSAKVVDALEQENVPFGHFDILSDDSVRQSLKSYSNWPTYPQVYVKGQLLGGCDIVLELQSNGLLGEEIRSMM